MFSSGFDALYPTRFLPILHKSPAEATVPVIFLTETITPIDVKT